MKKTEEIKKTSNNCTLKNKAFNRLPYGSIKPGGWLLRQLKIQAKGLTGHIEEVWEDLGPNNKWLGGNIRGWERGPYYVDGLLPLAYILDDKKLKERAQKWVDAFIEGQNEEGWIGPIQSKNHREYDYWPIFIVLKVFTQYFEFTGDQKVIQVMKKFFHFLLNHLEDNPLFTWGKYRWGELLLSIYWFYDKTGENWVLELGKIIKNQGYDWGRHFSHFQYTEKRSISNK